MTETKSDVCTVMTRGMYFFGPELRVKNFTPPDCWILQLNYWITPRKQAGVMWLVGTHLYYCIIPDVTVQRLVFKHRAWHEVMEMSLYTQHGKSRGHSNALYGNKIGLWNCVSVDCDKWVQSDSDLLETLPMILYLAHSVISLIIAITY